MLGIVSKVHTRQQLCAIITDHIVLQMEMDDVIYSTKKRVLILIVFQYSILLSWLCRNIN